MAHIGATKKKRLNGVIHDFEQLEYLHRAPRLPDRSRRPLDEGLQLRRRVVDWRSRAGVSPPQ